MAVKKTAQKPAKSTARKTSDRKPTSAAAKRGSGHSRQECSEGEAGEQLVTIDRRRASRRDGAGEEPTTAVAAPKLERRAKVQRRRQIDPTTCERDYSVDEVEFMNAMDDYKRTSGRMFPTCSEVLEVIRGLGYVKLSPAGKAMLVANDELNAAEDEALEDALLAEVAY
jgi:hypothetical protein